MQNSHRAIESSLVLGLAKSGLRSNPNNFTLLNNRAFSLARLGDIMQALEVFSRIDTKNLSVDEKAIWNATNGLIHYRSGDMETGAACYREALKVAKGAKNPKLEVLALLFYALEESQSGSSNSKEFANKALELGEKSTDPDVKILVKALEKQIR